MLALKQIRESLGISQAEAARRLNMSRQKYGNYELGKRQADYETLLQIAEVFGTTVDRIIGNRSTESTVEPVASPVEFVRIPVIGEAAAGMHCLADMTVIDYVSCDSALLQSGYDYVYLRVQGDSMEPELREGDLVLVRVQDTIESGEYAVVIVDGEDGLVKKIEIDSKHIALISENPYYPPRRFEKSEMNRIRIFGKVISSQRRYG